METAQGVAQPPSPLTGCYLLIVVGEPYTERHKDIILQRIAKGLLSWDVKDCLVDLEKELAIITEQALEGEEARYGERLIQYASENLVTEILIHPAVSTLAQCMRNLLSSFTRHRHIIHAGYTFAANGSWALQDGTFSLADFSEAFQEPDVQRVLHAYERGISLDVHCSPEGEWPRLPKEPFARACRARLNPGDLLTSGSADIGRFVDYLAAFLRPVALDTLLASSDVVGNIRFSRPTLYIFPGGQGDAALFGINGFNMLLDGGFSRKACFWDFVRHLDRLDAVLLTRLNNSNVGGISSILRRKKQDVTYPQIGHFFCNIQERRTLPSPDGDKDKDPLLINLLEEGQEIISNLRHMNLHPQTCYRDSDPINLYHKVGHGTLDMYVLSPGRDSKEVKEFLQKWNQCDQKLFANVGVKSSREFNFPIQNLVSIAALLVWQPANAEDTITRILFPGSSPQAKIFEGLDKLRNLECIKHATCSGKSLQPVSVGKKAIIEKVLPKSKSQAKEHKTIENNIINGIDGDVKEKSVKKSDSTESDRSSKAKKIEDSKVIENGDKPKPKSKPKVIGESQQKKKQPEKKASPTTPKKTEAAEAKKPSKPSPLGTPAKSTKDANNRKVVESKVKREISTKPTPPKPKAEKKPIQRKPTAKKAPMSPPKKLVNGVQKPDSISKKGKLDKEGTTDSSTVSTPSADQESILKKDITKLSQEDIQKLKAQELADLKEEQEAVKEIEAVFRKGEVRPVKAPVATIDDKLEKEEYIIIEKEVIEQEPESKEDETQKLARDSEESEKQRRHSSEQINIVDETPLKTKEMLSPEDKQDVSSEKKTTDKDIEDEIKDVAESHPDEKVSANIKSGDTTTAPTLPEDERIPIDEMTPLDEIKEDNGQVIEEKHVKEETKEKGVPVIQLPQKTFETPPKIPSVVGIRLNKQQQIRDIVKTPDEVADLPVHEEVDYEYTHELKIDAAAKSNEVAATKSDQHPPGASKKEQQKEVEHEKDNDEAKEFSYVRKEQKNLEDAILQNESILQKDILTELERKAVDAERKVESEELGEAKIELALEEQGKSEPEIIKDIMKHREDHSEFGKTETLGHKGEIPEPKYEEEKPRDDERGYSPDTTKKISIEQNIGGRLDTKVEKEDVEKHQETKPESDKDVDMEQIIIGEKRVEDKPMSDDRGKHGVEKTEVSVGKRDILNYEGILPEAVDAEKKVESEELGEAKIGLALEEQEKSEPEMIEDIMKHREDHSEFGKTETLGHKGEILEFKYEEEKPRDDERGYSPDATKRISNEQNIGGKLDTEVEKEDVEKHQGTKPESDKDVDMQQIIIGEKREEDKPMSDDRSEHGVEKTEISVGKKDIMNYEGILPEAVKIVEDKQKIITERDNKDDKPSDEKDKQIGKHGPEEIKKGFTGDNITEKTKITIDEVIVKHEDKLPESDKTVEDKQNIEQKHKEGTPGIDEEDKHSDSIIPDGTQEDSIKGDIEETVGASVGKRDIVKHKDTQPESDKVVRDNLVQKTEVTSEKQDILKNRDEPSNEKKQHLDSSSDVLKKDSSEDTFVDGASIQKGTMMKHEEEAPEFDQLVEREKDSITDQKHKEDKPSDSKDEYHDRYSPVVTKDKSTVHKVPENSKVTVEENNIMKHEAKLLENEKAPGGTIEKGYEEDKSRSDAHDEQADAIKEDSEKRKNVDEIVSEVDKDAQKEKIELISHTSIGKREKKDITSEFDKAAPEFDHDVKDKKVDSVHVDATLERMETNSEKQLKDHHIDKDEYITHKDIDGAEKDREKESHFNKDVLEETKEISHEQVKDVKDTTGSEKDSVGDTSEEELMAGVSKSKEHELTMVTKSTDIEKVDMEMRSDVQSEVGTDEIRGVPKTDQRDPKDTVTSMSERKESSQQLEALDDDTSLDQEIIAADLKPHVPSDPIEKIDLGRKSPKEREEDVIKIVASVAEVLKSDAPLEEFEGKLPISTFKPYTTELRETHITTVGSPVIETKVIRTDIPTIPEEPFTACASFLDGERKAISTQESERVIENKKISLMKESQEFMMATSKMLADMKSTTKQTEPDDTSADIEQVVEEKVEDESVATVQRMLVTASSEDGGEETEICPAGSIIFSKSSESSGRSSPDPSQKTPKSSIIDTSESLSTVRQILTDRTQQGEGIDDAEEDSDSKSISPRSTSQETERSPSIAKGDMVKQQEVESGDPNQIPLEAKTSESKPSDSPKVGAVMPDSSKGSEPVMLEDVNTTTKQEHTAGSDVSIKDSQVTGLPFKDDTDEMVSVEASIEVSSMILKDDGIESDGSDSVRTSGHDAKEDNDSQEKVDTHREMSPLQVSSQQEDNGTVPTDREEITHMTDRSKSPSPSHKIEEGSVTKAREDVKETVSPLSSKFDETAHKDEHHAGKLKEEKQQVELDDVRDVKEKVISGKHVTPKIATSEDIEAADTLSNLMTREEDCFGIGTPPKEQEMIENADREYELMKDIENEFFDDNDLLLNRRIPLEIDISKTQKQQHIDIDERENTDEKGETLDEKTMKLTEKQADTHLESSLDTERNGITASTVVEEPMIKTEGSMISEAAIIKDDSTVVGPKSEGTDSASSQKSKTDTQSDNDKTALVENMHDSVIDATKAIDHDKEKMNDNKTDLEKLKESAIGLATKMHIDIADEVVEIKEKSGDIIEEIEEHIKTSTKFATEALGKTSTDVIATVSEKIEESKQSIDEVKGTAASLLDSAADKLSKAATALENVMNGIEESIDKTVDSTDELVPEIKTVEDSLKSDHEKTLLEDISDAATESIDALEDVAKSITAGISGLFGKTRDAVEERSEQPADFVSSGIETTKNVLTALEKDSEDEIMRISKAVTEEVQKALGAVTNVTDLERTEKIEPSQRIEQGEEVCKDDKKNSVVHGVHEGISSGIETLSDMGDSILSKAERILDNMKSTTAGIINGTNEELSAAATTDIDIDSSKVEAFPLDGSKSITGTSVLDGFDKKSDGEQASLEKGSGIIASSSDVHQPKKQETARDRLTSSTSASETGVHTKSSISLDGDEKLPSEIEKMDEKVLKKEEVLRESAKDLEDTFEILTDMNKSVIFETCEKKLSDRECKDSSKENDKVDNLVDSSKDIEETFETVAQLSKSPSFEKCEKTIEPITIVENNSTIDAVESLANARGDEIPNKIEHQVPKNIEERLEKDVTYEKEAQLPLSMSFEKCKEVDVRESNDMKEMTDSDPRTGEFSQKIETSLGTLKSLGQILEDRVSKTPERISDKLPTREPKDLEEQLEDNVKDIGETYEHVAQLSKSLSFDKCGKVDTRDMVERMVEGSAKELVETFDIVDEMSKSVIFETCHREKEHEDQYDTLNQVHRDSIPCESVIAEEMVKSYESEKGERETMEKSTSKIEHDEKGEEKTEELVTGTREPLEKSTQEETEYRKVCISGGIEEKASEHDDNDHSLGKDKKDGLDEADIRSRRISVSKEISEKLSKGIEHDKTDHSLEKEKEDRPKATETDSSQRTVSERTLEKYTQETELEKTDHPLGDSNEDELEVEKKECRKLPGSEVSPRDRNGTGGDNIAADSLHHYEKHIADVITPPTVPVSPIVLEEIKFTSRSDALIKEVGLRSVTPGNDDSEIASSHADASSEQVSRIEMPLHPLDKDSDEEDLLSVTSQAAYSIEEEPKKIDIDPMSMSFYGSLPEESGSEGHETRTHLYEITQAKYTGLHKDEPHFGRAHCDVMSSSFVGTLPTSSSDSEQKDPIEAWGKPLGLPKPEKAFHEETDMMTASFYGELPSDSEDPIASWGKPLGLPSPAPPTTNDNNNKGTPKKERPKIPPYVSAKNKLNADDRKRAESPSKRQQRNAASPVYVDLTYAPHHGNAYYANVDFFKRVRARYYVFSGLEPGREVYDALLEAKQTWEDKDLEVTIIPTYDTDILGYWVAENEEILTKLKIDLSPSASRCTINLQDHETSCSAYRLEF